MKLHLEIDCSKLRLTLDKLYHVKFIGNKATLYTVYYTLAEAILYGLSSYGHTFKSYLEQIKKLQKSILKLKIVKEKCNKYYVELFSLSKYYQFMKESN